MEPVNHQQTPRIATAEELRPLLDALASMRDWALASITYVKRRNHLFAFQKLKIQQQLQQPAYRFNELINAYSQGKAKLPADRVVAEIERHQLQQAKLNLYARLYEYPRYPLPDTIMSKTDFDYTLVRVLTDDLNTILYKGDELFVHRVHSLAELKPHDLLTITYRTDYKHPRQEKIGCFKQIDGNCLLLEYNSPRLEKKYPVWSVSLYNVIHIYKVNTISRHWE